MTPDQLKAEAAKCRRLLFDIFAPRATPEYDKQMLAYVAPDDAQIVDTIVGPFTVEHPDGR